MKAIQRMAIKLGTGHTCRGGGGVFLVPSIHGERAGASRAIETSGIFGVATPLRVLPIARKTQVTIRNTA